MIIISTIVIGREPHGSLRDGSADAARVAAGLPGPATSGAGRRWIGPFYISSLVRRLAWMLGSMLCVLLLAVWGGSALDVTSAWGRLCALVAAASGFAVLMLSIGLGVNLLFEAPDDERARAGCYR